MGRKRLSLICLLGLLAGWGNAAWINGKAVLAQYLIASSWQQTLIQGTSVKPWPWADTWPVAALTFPRQARSLYALAGASGSSLAFGPGHADGTALPGQSGTQIYSAHRDTHFQFLGDMAIGDIILVQAADGSEQRFAVRETLVVDARGASWGYSEQHNEIHLITCYPFNSLSPNPSHRFVVIADLLTDSS
ncbi:class GN sortase [Alteromonas sp. C1M14]|uniref:class GN sortase n=1 Tax=Alteromonas sp. C1M14 TaxID=2841567 RepID=UPI001C0962B6|nr:class GN sortase [Alteromonas sp. C1M14]MBU2980001.1 class GN sortase [Alteromonas sp. C1M14]